MSNGKQHRGYHLPEYPESYWLDSAALPSFTNLNEDIKADTAVIGGGISGITTAYLLAKKGVKVALVEADTLMNGTTGHTTAKITAQHGLIYNELIKHFGKEKAKLYYEANMEACQFIENVVKEKGIECGFKKEDAYVYTNSWGYMEQLEKEANAYTELHIDGGFTEKLPLKIPALGAVVMKNQAQFHPLQYLKVLVEEIVNLGGSIYEHTVAENMERYGKAITIHMKTSRKIIAENVVVASHFPFHDGKAFFARMYPERSYVVAARAKEAYPGGMYISAEQPTRSVRSVIIDGEEHLLIGGNSHKTGQGGVESKNYSDLAEYANETFQTEVISYKWSAQDLITMDKLPYIGQISSDEPNVYVATGYRKWGMTNGTAAGLLLSDLITGETNRYKELYTPSRFKADPSLKKLVKENMNVAGYLIGGKLERPDKEIKDLKPDEGAVITLKGKRAGAYKDKHGRVHAVDTTCTHMGCEVNWNGADRTWDCPCHGSRFSYTGEVLEGPASEPLKKEDPHL